MTSKRRVFKPALGTKVALVACRGTSASQEDARIMVLAPGLDYNDTLAGLELFGKPHEIAKKGGANIWAEY